MRLTLTKLFFLIYLIQASFIFSSKVKELDAEEIINDNFTKLRNDFIANKEKETVGATVNVEIDVYRRSMRDMIMRKGAFKEQIDSAMNDEGSSTSNNFMSFLSLKTPFSGVDDPYYFFSNRSFITDIRQLPQTAKTSVVPWSSTYWATKYGGVSVRFPGNSMNTTGYINTNTGTFAYYYNWYRSVNMYHQPSEYNRYSSSSSFPSYVDSWYSPSEKYDLAMGDPYFTLTNYVKKEGAQWVKNGDVPKWYGICHGWVLAAYIFPTPTKPVTITGATGVTIRFLPDDIKALASQYWANVSYTTRWIGARCDFAHTDANWSRSSGCRSLNPGSFLITIGNWIGLQGKVAVLDPKADAEIWNQPMRAYSLRYYNVITNSFYSNANDAKVSLNQLYYCNTSRCRIILNNNSGAAYIVGAFIQVTYINETNPIHALYTQPNSSQTDNFDSSISLDSNMNIIGGDWNTNAYPNFVWRADESLPVTGVSDASTPYFDGSSDTLRSFTNYAQTGSQKGQVLKSFISWLVAQSSAVSPSSSS